MTTGVIGVIGDFGDKVSSRRKTGGEDPRPALNNLVTSSTRQVPSKPTESRVSSFIWDLKNYGSVGPSWTNRSSGRWRGAKWYGVGAPGCKGR